MSEQYENAFREKVELGATVPVDTFVSAVKGALQARSAVTYLIWKELRQVMPEDKATALLGRAYRQFGRDAGTRWGAVSNAAEALCAQSSPGGFAVFGQELRSADADFAEKDFAACPHVEQWRAMGATDDEVRTLCQDILSEGDYGNLDAHPGIDLEFRSQIGAGDDRCAYCLSCAAAKRHEG